MFRQPNFIPHLFTPISARRGVLLQLGWDDSFFELLERDSRRKKKLVRPEKSQTIGQKGETGPEIVKKCITTVHDPNKQDNTSHGPIALLSSYVVNVYSIKK
jgi:hypothetical protein